jgi:hypothetical protein
MTVYGAFNKVGTDSPFITAAILNDIIGGD